MKSKLSLFFVSFLMVNASQAAITPSGSQFDKRNQIVNFNPLNTTVINSAIGYLMTLVFDEDETVLNVQTGYEQGWDIQKNENFVYIRVVPVKQMVEEINDKGALVTKEIALDPESDLSRWQTNLFIVTTKRNYSIELNAKSFTQPEKISFVVNFRYPQQVKEEKAEVESKRLAELKRKNEINQINFALENAKKPRNWKYYQRVAKGSELIMPDYAYDDGRFTYFGFNPTKKIPSLFMDIANEETVTAPRIEKSGNYTVLVANQINDRWILRLGKQVIGIENHGFGQVHLVDSDTVSPNVIKEVIQ
ncbi:TrbG/VirB9 family P-type conjugative transfer protein [Proteus mirabilis]